jgi:IS5 family transposase
VHQQEESQQAYEFGCEVSITTTNAPTPRRSVHAHVAVLHGNPYDGHTLRQVIEET